jgi:hypothetical protein
MIFITLTSVGGYMVHAADLPKYLKLLEFVSPYKWLLPILTENEFKSETIASTASQQLCKHKQVNIQMTTKLSDGMQFYFCLIFLIPGSTARNHCTVGMSNAEWHGKVGRLSTSTRSTHPGPEKYLRIDFVRNGDCMHNFFLAFIFRVFDQHKTIF